MPVENNTIQCSCSMKDLYRNRGCTCEWSELEGVYCKYLSKENFDELKSIIEADGMGWASGIDGILVININGIDYYRR